MFYLASFMLPFIIIMIALIALHIIPFGDNTLVISDANGLYINYIGYVGRFVKGLEGFTYSFEKGLGGNMMPHMGGTMSNPIFALVAFFNVADYPLAFTWISVLNFCICGLTMYILLADIFGHKRSNLIFSTSYALSGFMVANVFQIIFFMGCHALPLVVLGLLKIFQGRNPLLYVISLTYSIITAAYFGYTICIFSVLLFIAILWVDKDKLSGRKLSIFFHYGISSICSGLIAIVIWLPAIIGIMGGRLDQTKITDFSFWEKMPFVEIFSKLFTGANTVAQLVDGLPNIFVGLLPIALVILFFMNKRISRRMKAAAGLIIGFYLVCFYIIAFDMLMHGGTTTNWFNFRYSYIFSFLLLLIAAYEWQYIDEFSFKELKNCFIGLAIAALLIFSRKYEHVMGSEVLLDFGLLIVIFLAYRLYRLKPKYNPKHTYEAVVILVVSFSLFINYTVSTKNIMDWGIKNSDYQETVTAVDPLIKGIQLGDHGFYRMEVNKQRSGNLGNDPMLYGYYGVGHGGSNERSFVREELSKLGIAWFDMRNYYAQGIPAATDALLGIKYLIANEDVTDEKGYIRMTDMEKMGLATCDEIYDCYQSTYALPIGFVADASVNGLELNKDDLFDNLNRVWSSIIGEEKAAFIEEDSINFRTINLSDTESIDAEKAREIVQEYDKKSQSNDTDINEAGGQNTKGQDDAVQHSIETEKSNLDANSSESDGAEMHAIMDARPEFASSVEFSFTASQDGPVYVYHRAAFSPSYGWSMEPVVKYMGYYHKGEEVKGYLLVQGDYVSRITFEEFAGRFRVAYADLDALENMSATVTARPSTIEKIKDSHLTGTMTLEEGQELLFTIPWDEGWTCYVDGQKTELKKVLGVFMAAEVAPGEHSYEMVFTPVGMNIGIKISIGAFIVLVLYLAFGRRLLNKIQFRKKEENEEEQATAKASTDPAMIPTAREEAIVDDLI